MFPAKALGQKRAERITHNLSAAARNIDWETVAAKFTQNLTGRRRTAQTARRFLRPFRPRLQGRKAALPSRYRAGNGGTLRTNCRAKAAFSILQPRYTCPFSASSAAPDKTPRIGRVRALHRFYGMSHQFFFCHFILAKSAAKNSCPADCIQSPKTPPRSRRYPQSSAACQDRPGCTLHPTASSGVYSRVWSVPRKPGSQP